MIPSRGRGGLRLPSPSREVRNPLRVLGDNAEVIKAPVSETHQTNDFEDVGAESEIPEGCMKGFDVAGERVLVARAGGRLHAVGGLCTHQIAHLEDGVLEGNRVSCPRHGACFDLETGEPLSAPADMPLPVYRVRAVGGRIWVSSAPLKP
jgi:3-phenylpropionate/trans-cinnamate dioxygenase ferredoxin subunit